MLFLISMLNIIFFFVFCNFENNHMNSAIIRSYRSTIPRRCVFCGSFMLFLSCFGICFHACLFVDPAGKGLISWLSFVKSNCAVVTFPVGILGQVWCLIVSTPDLWPLSYSLDSSPLTVDSNRTVGSY